MIPTERSLLVAETISVRGCAGQELCGGGACRGTQRLASSHLSCLRLRCVLFSSVASESF